MIEKVKRYGLIAAGAVGTFAVAAPAFAADLFTMPSVDTIAASSTATVNASFLLFWSVGIFITGFVIGTLILVALVRVVKRGVSRVLAGAGGGRGGGRGRRRR